MQVAARRVGGKTQLATKDATPMATEDAETKTAEEAKAGETTQMTSAAKTAEEPGA